MSPSASTHEKLEELRELNLPSGHYAITSSGPLGVRGIREINDLDLIVDDELWKELCNRHKEVDGKVQLSPNVEAIPEQMFSTEPGEPTVEEQIASAETIEDLPFVMLEYVIYFKSKMGRDKDKRDIELVRAWQQRQK